jgi:hypothetical protein
LIVPDCWGGWLRATLQSWYRRGSMNWTPTPAGAKVPTLPLRVLGCDDWRDTTPMRKRLETSMQTSFEYLRQEHFTLQSWRRRGSMNWTPTPAGAKAATLPPMVLGRDDWRDTRPMKKRLETPMQICLWVSSAREFYWYVTLSQIYIS